ncbi:MAG: NAD-dependent malic enzyme [Deltaproteobacteria bacterium]|nr:NAD-dependent malic enzyme [Deltaproteobacteria bacterium]
MSDKQKIIKTLRCKNQKIIGVLAKLINTISGLGGDIGNVSTVSLGDFNNVRDISVMVDGEDHLNRIVEAVRKLSEVELEAVIDEVLEMHRGGKIILLPKHPVTSIDDLRKVYTPGVASVCRLIKEDPRQAAQFTTISKTVALITNGSRVLGLGNLGPVPSMPVMEGKAALFNQFSGLHMIPILMDTLDVKRFVDAVETISCTFSAIQLEDIRAPDCFKIEEELIRRLKIPVMHDDQHGTATVALAGLINSCQLAGIDIKKIKVGQVGLGAAGSAIARLIMKYTGNPVYGTDLSQDCIDRFKSFGGEYCSLEYLMKNCQAVVATTGIANLIKPEMIQKKQVILALSNPFPEISIADAINAGAAFATDGSRVNNLLGYPGIFKGALDSKATRITDEMFIAAVEAIVQQTPEGEIIPDALDMTVHAAVSKAVAKAAVKAGVCINS